MSETLPKGTIYTFTEIGTGIYREGAPAGFVGFAPYFVAIVELEGGPRLTGRLTDLGDKKVEIGMSVEMVTRRQRDNIDERGIIHYGYAFRPIIERLSEEGLAEMRRRSWIEIQTFNKGE